MKLKKILIVLLCLFSFLICSCSNNVDSDDDNNNSTGVYLYNDCSCSITFQYQQKGGSKQSVILLSGKSVSLIATTTANYYYSINSNLGSKIEITNYHTFANKIRIGYNNGYIISGIN